MTLTDLLFYFFGLLILGSAFLMVFSNNIVHSALYMVAAFFGVACIYLMLYADFLAVVQLIVYIGSISVLLVFGVMLTRRGNICESNTFNRYKLISLIAAAGLFSVITSLVLMSKYNDGANVTVNSSVNGISNLFLNNYIIAFEIAGLLLLVALVGAIVIGKGMGGQK